MQRLTWSLLALVALTGCGTEIQFNGSLGDGGSGGDTTSTTSGSGGGGGSGGGSGGTTPACPAPTHDRFELGAVIGGQSMGCDLDFWGPTGEATVSGVVVAANEGYLAIDSCPPTAVCDSALNEIFFSASELWNPIPVGTLVQASVHVEVDWSCRHQLLVTNLPYWESLANPVSHMNNVWLAGSDGGIGAPARAPYEVSLDELACEDHDLDREDYQIRFSGSSQGPLTLRMGESEMWLLPSLEGEYAVSVKNLSSYELLGIEDAGFSGAYWMAAQLYMPFDETQQ